MDFFAVFHYLKCVGGGPRSRGLGHGRVRIRLGRGRGRVLTRGGIVQSQGGVGTRGGRCSPPRIPAESLADIYDTNTLGTYS